MILKKQFKLICILMKELDIRGDRMNDLRDEYELIEQILTTSQRQWYMENKWKVKD